MHNVVVVVDFDFVLLYTEILLLFSQDSGDLSGPDCDQRDIFESVGRVVQSNSAVLERPLEPSKTLRLRTSAPAVPVPYLCSLQLQI